MLQSYACLRYRPNIMEELRTCLGSCPAEMPVEVERGVPVTAETGGRPPGLVLCIPSERDRWSAVRVERV